MVHSFLLFQHPAELAEFLCLLYNAIAFGRIEDTRIELNFSAVLFTKELGGIDNGVNVEPKEMQVYTDVFVLVDRFACVPICLINAMMMTVRARNKIYIERVTFNTHLITTIVKYICDEECWPAHFTKDEMIAAACSNYSMRAMDLFAADWPRGLNGSAAWLFYELPMAAHGFVAYMLEIYLVVAAEVGALDVVKAFFAQFARGDGEVFDRHNTYGICNILLSLDDETFPNLDAETIDEQVTWAFALLDDLLHVPRLTVDELPGIVDAPMGFEELIAPSPVPPSASNTPLSALLTAVEVQALFASPVTLQTPARGHLTPRQLF